MHCYPFIEVCQRDVEEVQYDKQKANEDTNIYVYPSSQRWKC